jgi:Ca-activated chloride channel family protein
VTLPVSVLDRDGRFISSLEQRDFQIFDNGVQQKVEYFQSVESPFTVILLIDVSPSTQYHIDEIQDAAIGFVNQLRPEDKVMVVSFDENVHVLSPVTNDRKVLEEAILQADFGGGTSLFEAVDFVINRELKKLKDGKRSCFLPTALTLPLTKQVTKLPFVMPRRRMHLFTRFVMTLIAATAATNAAATTAAAGGRQQQ